MAQTKIDWADAVWNPVTGCTKVSAGCQNCYAERMAKRLAGRCGYPEKDPFGATLHLHKLNDPFNWKKPRRVFVNSMGDLFHEDVPFTFLFRLWLTMQHRDNFQHTFLILTKRPERMLEFYNWLQERPKCGEMSVEFARPHIWLGVTAENQETADQRIPLLLQIPVAVRFVSVEPMLGPVDLTHLHHNNEVEVDCLNGTHGIIRPHKGDNARLDWVICGAESGPGARPMHPDWVRSLRDQCQAAGVPFFFKQWGEFKEVRRYWSFAKYADTVGRVSRAIGSIKSGRATLLNADGSDLVNGGPDHKVYPISHLERVGKKVAGRILDGRTWEEYPNA